MNKNHVIKKPEELELEKKISELSALEVEIAQSELELATTNAELNAFSNNYYKIVGERLVKLDNLAMEISKILALLNPGNPAVQERYKEARILAEETAETIRNIKKDNALNANFSDELKSLYRDIAKKIHPDLAANEKDREKRTKLMADTNSAYKSGNEKKLQAILRDWESSPDNIIGSDIGSELIRTLRKIAQVKSRLEIINSELQTSAKSTISQIKSQVDEISSKGANGLNQIKQQIDNEITIQEKRLHKLKEEYLRSQKSFSNKTYEQQ